MSSVLLQNQQKSNCSLLIILGKWVLIANWSIRLAELYRMLQIYYRAEESMHSLVRNNSRAITSYSHQSLYHPQIDCIGFYLKEFWLRKSIFNPPQGLAQVFAARRHLAGVEVPKIEIVYCSSRWLLLQTPQIKTKFFQYLNSGRLGCREQLLLKLFKNFVALIRLFGYFRPTEKMIFLERWELRVWINEDVFSNVPSMPIPSGGDGEKHFVISFLALVQASLGDWQRVSNVATIEETSRMLQWRCKLAKGSLTAVHASREVHFKPGQSKTSFDPSELAIPDIVTCSQQLQGPAGLDRIKSGLSSSFVVEDQLLNRVKTVRMVKNSAEIIIPLREEEEIRQTKKKFGLHSTSSTLGNFSEKWRTTVGRKKIQERSEAVEQPPAPPPPVQSIQMEFQDLFAEEGNHFGQGCDEAELQRIAQEIEEVLIW